LDEAATRTRNAKPPTVAITGLVGGQTENGFERLWTFPPLGVDIVVIFYILIKRESDD
jgi:hypothetical protein